MIIAAGIPLVAGWIGAPFLSWYVWLVVVLAVPGVVIVLGLVRHRGELRSVSGTLAAGGATRVQGSWIHRRASIQSAVNQDCLELDLVVDPDELSGGDRLVSASLDAESSYGVVREAYFRGRAIAKFLRQLSELDVSHDSVAELSSVDFDEFESGLRLEFRSTGRLTVCITLKQDSPAGGDPGIGEIQTTLILDPSIFSALSRKLKKLLTD